VCSCAHPNQKSPKPWTIYGRTAKAKISERPHYREILKSVTYLFDGGRRGKPLLGQFDSQVSEALELILQFEEHLFRLCYSDLVLQGLEPRAWNVNVEAGCVDEFEEIGVDLGSMPEMKLF
jgi:hypothetical protein